MFIILTILKWVLIVFVALYGSEQKLITDPEHFKMLDDNITKFLFNPNKKGWERKLRDIDVFISSMRNMVMILNGSLPGCTEDFLQNVDRFVNKNERPVYIEVDIVEHEVQPATGITEDQFWRFYLRQMESDKLWESICKLYLKRTKSESTYSE